MVNLTLTKTFIILPTSSFHIPLWGPSLWSVDTEEGRGLQHTYLGKREKKRERREKKEKKGKKSVTLFVNKAFSKNSVHILTPKNINENFILGKFYGALIFQIE